MPNRARCYPRPTSVVPSSKYSYDNLSGVTRARYAIGRSDGERKGGGARSEVRHGLRVRVGEFLSSLRVSARCRAVADHNAVPRKPQRGVGGRSRTQAMPRAPFQVGRMVFTPVGPDVWSTPVR